MWVKKGAYNLMTSMRFKIHKYLYVRICCIQSVGEGTCCQTLKLVQNIKLNSTKLNLI